MFLCRSLGGKVRGREQAEEAVPGGAVRGLALDLQGCFFWWGGSVPLEWRWKMNRIIKRRGHFALVQYEEGFLWILRLRGGERWYWDPGTRQWTGHPYPSPTPEAATAGLDPDVPQAASSFHHHNAGLHAGARS
jgi:hypothetical protein